MMEIKNKIPAILRSFLVLIVLVFLVSKVADSHNLPTPLGSTEVGQALKNSLDGTGKFSSITFSDDTVQTTAGGGGGDVTKVGTPVDNEIAVWTGDGTLEGEAGLTYTGGVLNVVGVLELEETVSSITGVITKNGGNRFIHNFHHPTGNTAIPIGNNVCVGDSAGNFTMGSTATSTSHASNDVFIGTSSGLSNTTGSDDVFIGTSSGSNNTTGNNDVFIGINSGLTNTTGSDDVFIGRDSGLSNTSGANDVFIGRNSGSNNTSGANDVFIGRNSGSNNTTGANNVFIGRNSGQFFNGTTGNNTTSDFCVLIGKDTSVSADNTQHETVIGYNAIGKGNDTVILGAEGANVRVYATGGLTVNDEGLDVDTQIKGLTDDNLFYLDSGNDRGGIGTNTPLSKFHVDSNASNTTPILTLENAAGNIQIFRTDVTPENAVTGSIGDIGIDSTNGVGYIKSSGTATNTGWTAFAGVPVFKSYSLANPGSAGIFYIGGHYDFVAADSNLTIGGTVIQTHGIVGEAHAAHAFCVASGAGGTDLVLTVTGISITDDGVKNLTDSEIIVADTDTAITDQYFETSKKWLGQVTYTLTGAAGSFDFNYGFVKHEDFGNRDFVVTDFEATGEARANETGLNIELLHHEATAFLYHATAFIPNQTALVSLATDHGTDGDDVASGHGFAYKRAGMSTAVSAANGEGLMIRVTTSVNNSINDASFHIGVLLK